MPSSLSVSGRIRYAGTISRSTAAEESSASRCTDAEPSFDAYACKSDSRPMCFCGASRICEASLAIRARFDATLSTSAAASSSSESAADDDTAPPASAPSASALAAGSLSFLGAFRCCHCPLGCLTGRSSRDSSSSPSAALGRRRGTRSKSPAMSRMLLDGRRDVDQAPSRPLFSREVLQYCILDRRYTCLAEKLTTPTERPLSKGQSDQPTTHTRSSARADVRGRV